MDGRTARSLGLSLAFALAACHGRVPADHRTGAGACATPAPPGQPGSSQSVTSAQCTSDSDCANVGPQGRCYEVIVFASTSVVPTNVCVHDACAGDGDCGDGGVCDCRNDTALHANVCVPGNCRVDSDCGSNGYCSPSAMHACSPGAGLATPPLVVAQGYYCHTSSDECVDDSDCPATDAGASGADCKTRNKCAFDPNAGHWRCLTFASQ